MPEIEVWHPILGYPQCEVSSFGRVRQGTRILSQRLLKGYPGVTIPGALRHKRLFTVHSLVAAAFIGPRPTGQQINHKDVVKDNIRHSWAVLGNARYGEKNPAAKLTQEKADAIRNEYVPRKISAGTLAVRYSVTKRTILNIIHHKNWVTAVGARW